MFLLMLLLFFLKCSSPILANDRNIFGLHLTQTSDIDKTASVINSTGGDWGWVTIVIRQDQLNQQTWQEFFDKCRQYHLIPIIRLATIMENDHWKKPEFSDIDSLVSFLNSLIWPTKQQHIILFNEINHGLEWGGEINLKNYTDIAIYASHKFKEANPNFIVLGAALDLASPEKSPEFKSAQNTYQEIYLYRPEYFEALDGLASHSYPNHGFVGLPNDTGQHSIRGYLWETKYLKSLGLSKNYPIFITETGWPHRTGETIDNKLYSTTTTAVFLLKALNYWSQDTSVKAVTPFIFNFPYEPFDHFSWVDQTESLYPEYQLLIDSPKSTNFPEQITDFKLIKNLLPLLIFENNEYGGQITLKNTGQSIWGETNFCLKPQSSENITLEAICTGNRRILPNQTEVFHYKFTIGGTNSSTFIGWDKLPQFEISPVTNTGFLYSPKLSWKEKIKQFFGNLFL